MTHTRIGNGLKIDRRIVLLTECRSANIDPRDLNLIEKIVTKEINKKTNKNLIIAKVIMNRKLM